MFPLLSQSIKDASVLRRLEFAANFLPNTMPNYSDCLASFSLKGKEDTSTLTPQQAHQFVENLQVIDKRAFSSDLELTKEIVLMNRPRTDIPLGVVLISRKVSCRSCGSKLYIRADRASKVTVYDDNLGTLPGTHYTK